MKIRRRLWSGVEEDLHKPLMAFASVSAIDILVLPLGKVPKTEPFRALFCALRVLVGVIRTLLGI